MYVSGKKGPNKFSSTSIGKVEFKKRRDTQIMEEQDNHSAERMWTRDCEFFSTGTNLCHTQVPVNVSAIVRHGWNVFH